VVAEKTAYSLGGYFFLAASGRYSRLPIILYSRAFSEKRLKQRSPHLVHMITLMHPHLKLTSGPTRWKVKVTSFESEPLSIPIASLDHMLSTMCYLVGRQQRHPFCKNVRCCSVGGDDLTGSLHVL